jgi:hypothetical protein
MSDDLMRRLADYRSDLDAGIGAGRSTELLDPIDVSVRPRRRVLLAVAVAAIVVGGIGVVVAANRGPAQQSISGVDDTTLATVPGSSPETSPATTLTGDSNDSWDWLAPFGEEVPAPPMPDGWQVLDFEDFRFAVPADWVVPSTNGCTSTASGVVLIAATEPTMCISIDPPPESVLALVPAGPDDGTTGVPVTVGTLSATQFPGKCIGCPPVYRFDDGYQVSVTGPDADEVLGTFTDAGARRVLQGDDEADTTTWQVVEYQGISLKVPARWPVEDLPASFDESTLPGGGIRTSSQLDPGYCGGPMFPSDHDAQVSLGISQLQPSCAEVTNYDLAPGDGLWIRSTADSRSQPDGTPIAHGVVDGLDVFLIRMHRTNAGAPTPALDLVVRDGSKTSIWVTLGVGTDVSIARSILRSLHAA